MPVPFIGPSYNLDSRAASTQRTVNMYPVPVEPGNETAGMTLKDIPGLVVFVASFAFVPSVTLASPPYPMAVFEEASISAAVLGGSLIDSVHQFSEEASIGATVLGGALETLLYTHTLDAEEASVSASVLGGSLTTLLYAHSLDVEEASIDATVLGGTLITSLITHSLDAESASIGANVLGGSLT